MLITKDWSEPKALKHGKNILVRSSQGNFSYKIFSVNDASMEGVITDRVHTIVINDELLKSIPVLKISFRANINDELHVDFQVI